MAEEQSRKIDQIGGRSLVFDADIKDESKEIELAKNGNYTHILVIPLLAGTSTFCNMIKDSEFRKHLAMVVVDESPMARLYNNNRSRTTGNNQ
jgi:hypothetical protein